MKSKIFISAILFRRGFAIAATTVLLLPHLAQAQPITGKVVSVGDGDTLRVSSQGKTKTIRLACVDAAEIAQKPYGPAAAQRLKQLLPVGETVKLRVADTDRYGRTVAKVYKGNLSINLALVQEG